MERRRWVDIKRGRGRREREKDIEREVEGERDIGSNCGWS
jgi:hypothetical protein